MSWYKEKFDTFSKNITAVFSNVLFLILWALAQILLDFVLGKFQVSDWMENVLLAFKIIFLVSTLITVLIIIYRDTRLIIIQSNSKINSEKFRLEHQQVIEKEEQLIKLDAQIRKKQAELDTINAKIATIQQAKSGEEGE